MDRELEFGSRIGDRSVLEIGPIKIFFRLFIHTNIQYGFQDIMYSRGNYLYPK